MLSKSELQAVQELIKSKIYKLQSEKEIHDGLIRYYYDKSDKDKDTKYYFKTLNILQNKRRSIKQKISKLVSLTNSVKKEMQ